MIIEPHEVEWVFSPWQRRQGLDVIIEKVLVRPILPARWYPNKDRFTEALSHRAETLNAPLPHAVKAVADANLWQVSYPDLPRIALDAYGEPLPGALDAWAHELRTQVNELVTVDLLGPAWRPRRTTPRRRAPTTAEFDVWLQIDLLLARPDLSEQERALIEAFIAADMVMVKAAQTLEISPNAAWLRFSRLRKKLLA
jgi:hypothetical protein